jgi:hypothetical protein
MRFYVPFVAATVTLAMVAAIAGPAVAQTAPPAAGGLSSDTPTGWVVDGTTGCKVWDDVPAPDETISWSGGCVDGMADGSGTLQYFVGGKPGTRYEGELHGGRADGHGINLDPDGTRYEGGWRNNAAQGPGVYTKAGQRYEGIWEKGCLKQGAAELAIGVSRASCGFK